MADDRTYGFNRDDAQALLQSISTGEHTFVEVKPRQRAGGETQIINFQIISSDPNIRRALVQVEQRAFRGQVYGSILNDEVVYVYDTRGCYLNKRNEDLTGRFGSAVLMYTDDAAAELHFSEQYEPPEKYWCVQDLCCPNIVCED